jgi:DNA-binding CsgD family transcriptional regulator
MALTHAEAADDRDTLLVALRARRLATLSPDALDETLALADRVLELVSAASREDIRHAFWAHVWRIQTWFVRGRLDLVADELSRAGVVADRLGEPVVAAQLLRLRAVLAATRGAFGDATDMAERAYTAMRRAGQTIADCQHAGFRASIGRFVGYPPDLADAVALPMDAAGPFAAMGRVRSALVLAGLGRRGDAAAEYRRLDPVASWRLPSYLRLTAWTLRLRVAVALAIPADTAALVELLAPHRGLHAGGGLSYDGPVELAVATGAAALGDLDNAAADLQVALTWSRRQGAGPFVAEAAVLLAEVLARRAGPADVEQAATLLDEADTIATDLDMTPVAARVRRLRAGLGLDRSKSPLSVRELQVARLLARGLTNRQVAETLVVSQRTAENHVQHILTKLGMTNRTQIAAWVATHPTPEPE